MIYDSKDRYNTIIQLLLYTIVNKLSTRILLNTDGRKTENSDTIVTMTPTGCTMV